SRRRVAKPPAMRRSLANPPRPPRPPPARHGPTFGPWPPDSDPAYSAVFGVRCCMPGGATPPSSFARGDTCMASIRTALVLALAASAAPALAQSPSKLLRLPDVHGNRIAFVHGGDIHVVAASGGTAQRLTTHPGQELYPKFSPDGQWIAFSAEYNGTRQVYV